MSTAHAPFGDCKNAALHLIRDVQASGVLLAIHSSNQRIEYCSANSADLLGCEPAQLLGQTRGDWLGSGSASLPALTTGEGKFDWRQFPGAPSLDVIRHCQGGHEILEFQQARPIAHWWDHAERTLFIEALSAVRTVEECRRIIVDWIFDHSGYDHVMMYQFLPDWDGEVVHERCAPGVGGFLGIRFPASDIPPNARKLFTINWQRMIVDVDSEPVLVLSADDEVHPLDLTFSTLRSAHPAHIQYLRNMGVQASLTLSMMAHGRLWGLIACHHRAPREASILDRFALEEMARLVSLHLTNLLDLVEQHAESHMREQLSCLQGAMSTEADDARLALSSNLGLIRQSFGGGGAWLRLEGEEFFSGGVPDPLQLAALRSLLKQYSRYEISHYAELPASLAQAGSLSATASGLLFVPFGSEDFVAILRPEIVQTVNWAGKPADSDADATTNDLLSPRNSFATWSQQVQNSAKPWSKMECAFASELRADLQLFLETARLEYVSLHDPLTGVANRVLFRRRLQQEMRGASLRKSMFAVLMIDLDRFKQVNDTFGHAAGDRVLTEVARRLTGLTRHHDTVARLGGDEFAIVLAGVSDKASAASTAARIVEKVGEPIDFMGQFLEVGISIGIAIYPIDTWEEE